MATKLQRALNPGPMKKGPANFEGRVAIHLGTLLEFELSKGAVVRGGRSRLLYFPDVKALAFFEKAKESRPSRRTWDELSETTAGRAAMRKFHAWADRESKQASEVKFSAKKDRWYKGGSLARLDYKSDKRGETAEYTHDFGRGVHIYLLTGTGPRAPAMWVIKGGRMTVTERGIVG